MARVKAAFRVDSIAAQHVVSAGMRSASSVLISCYCAIAALGETRSSMAEDHSASAKVVG